MFKFENEVLLSSVQVHYVFHYHSHNHILKQKDTAMIVLITIQFTRLFYRTIHKLQMK